MTGREGRSNSVGKSVSFIDGRRCWGSAEVTGEEGPSRLGERMASGLEGRLAMLAREELLMRAWNLARRF